MGKTQIGSQARGKAPLKVREPYSNEKQDHEDCWIRRSCAQSVGRETGQGPGLPKQKVAVESEVNKDFRVC